MSHLAASVRKDAVLQVRHQYYTISLGLAVVIGAVISIFLQPEHVQNALPAAMLFLVGGTTLVFVGALILDEKDKGILQALILSPLSRSEYLAAKVLSLTLLATLEVGIMVAIPLAWFHLHDGTPLPHVPVMLLGIVSFNVMYTLLGIAVSVRFKKVTSYMMPMGAGVVVLQLPILHFLGVAPHPAWLLVPTSAPVVLIRGAFTALTPGEWIYATLYIIGLCVGLAWWARRAYDRHIVQRMT